MRVKDRIRKRKYAFRGSDEETIQIPPWNFPINDDPMKHIRATGAIKCKAHHEEESEFGEYLGVPEMHLFEPEPFEDDNWYVAALSDAPEHSSIPVSSIIEGAGHRHRWLPGDKLGTAVSERYFNKKRGYQKRFSSK